MSRLPQHLFFSQYLIGTRRGTDDAPKSTLDLDSKVVGKRPRRSHVFHVRDTRLNLSYPTLSHAFLGQCCFYPEPWRSCKDKDQLVVKNKWRFRAGRNAILEAWLCRRNWFLIIVFLHPSCHKFYKEAVNPLRTRFFSNIDQVLHPVRFEK